MLGHKVNVRTCLLLITVSLHTVRKAVVFGPTFHFSFFFFPFIAANMVPERTHTQAQAQAAFFTISLLPIILQFQRTPSNSCTPCYFFQLFNHLSLSAYFCLSSGGNRWCEHYRMCVPLQFWDRKRQKDCHWTGNRHPVWLCPLLLVRHTQFLPFFFANEHRCTFSL